MIHKVPCSFVDPEHFVKTAKRLSEEDKNSIFIDQFENLLNFESHYTGSGPEIWDQTDGRVNAFVSCAGTGGTIAGISRYLKE